jgi:chromosome segregation ATPase
MGLLDMDMPTLLSYSKQGHVSKDVMDAFKEAGRLQGLVADAQRRVADLQKQRQEIDTDQARIRQNMQTIDRASDLYSRYMKKLTDQETRVEQLEQQLRDGRDAVQKAQNDLNTYIAGLNVE